MDLDQVKDKEFFEGEMHVEYQLLTGFKSFVKMTRSVDSPIEVYKHMYKDRLILKHKNNDIGKMFFGPRDPEESDVSNLFDPTVEILQFNPTYSLSQEWDHKNPNAINVYRDIRDMFEKNSVPYFIKVENKNPDSFIAGGYNPTKNIRIENKRPDLFPL